MDSTEYVSDASDPSESSPSIVVEVDVSVQSDIIEEVTIHETSFSIDEEMLSPPSKRHVTSVSVEDTPKSPSSLPRRTFSSVSISRTQGDQCSVFLELRNVCLDVPLVQGTQKSGAPGASSAPSTKRILHEISAFFPPGTMTAIMGPSGAGKTSLLSVLSNRHDSGSVSGEILVNGKPLNDSLLRKISGFVPQEDILTGSMTVMEALNFAADMQLPSSTPQHEKTELIEMLLNELGLLHTRDTLIGYSGKAAAVSQLKRGVSGGERKRISVAVELITDPALLFLDEPTTGLDSYAARAVCLSLQRLAETGKTILATIHQPSATIFKMFDNIILLADGFVAYAGPTRKIAEYFESVDIPFPLNENPAETSLAIIHKGSANSEKSSDLEIGSNDHALSSSVSVGASLGEKYSNSPFRESWFSSDQLSSLPPPITVDKENGSTKYAASWWKQVSLVFQRQWKNILREPMQLRVRLMQHIMVGLIIGLLWLQLPNDQRVLQDKTGALFFLVTFITMSSEQPPVFLFSSERSVFMRERSSNYYATSSYFLGKFLADIPMILSYPTIFGTITYFLLGLQLDAGRFFTYIAILMSVALGGTSIGFCVATGITNHAVALAVNPLFVVPIFLFGGLFVSVETTPVYFIWVQVLSPVFWGFQAIFANEFSGMTLSPDRVPPGGSPILSGDALIRRLFPTRSLSPWLCIVVMLCIVFSLFALSFFFLWYRSRKRR